MDETCDSVLINAGDPALMLAATHNCRVEIWHLGITNGTVSNSSVTTGYTQITSFDDAVVDVAFSPDSTAIAVASLDGYVRFFSVNVNGKNPRILHKWKPHEGKILSGIIFLDNISHPNIGECPLWKWVVTSAEYNSEIKLWSWESWKCYQTIRFKSDDSCPIIKKLTLDMSASFLLISDINRKALYVMHIGQEQEEKNLLSEGEDASKSDDRTVSKVSSITQLHIPFPAISVVIREASIRPPSQPMGDFDEEKKAFKVEMLMFILQPKSLENCKVVFELGSSIQLDEATGTSFSNMNTTSEYESMNVVKAASVTNHINLLTPDAFISPTKTNMDSSFQKQSSVTSPGTVCPSPPVSSEILALSSQRQPTPEVISSTTPKRNSIPSGCSSSSREEVGTRPMSECSSESPIDTSSANVPNATATHLFNNQCNSSTVEDSLCTYSSSAVAAPTLPSVSADLNGSFQELFKEPLVVEALPAQAAFPSILPPLNVQQQPKEHAAREMDAGNPIQFQMMQQTMDAQRVEQQQLKNEIGQLKAEMTRSQFL